MPHGKLLNRPVNMLYPLEVDDNETIQQATPETPIQNTEPEEPIATRTRRAIRKRDGTRPIFMSTTNCLIIISLILITTVRTNTTQNCKWISDELQTAFIFKKIEKIKDTTCNFSKPYIMNSDIIIDEGVDKWQTKNAKDSDSKDQLIEQLTVQFEKTTETIEELAHFIAHWKLITISIFSSN
uniref:Uncharacterized protein n=1 Tax=Loa loa TaxID=7209 RepID=A0A1I7W054_LOALO